MTHTSRAPRRAPASPRHRLAPALIALLLVGWLAGCKLGAPTSSDSKALSLLAIFPASGEQSAIYVSMANAVDLAVKQNTSLGGGYTLSATHLDETDAALGASVAQALANPQVMGAIGPATSPGAEAALPALAQAGVVTISPTAMLPGLTQASQASANGVTFSQLHPKGKPISFFRQTADDSQAGVAAADLALASTSAHGFGAHAVFVVDDGTPSGKAQAAAFERELKAAKGTLTGSASFTLGDAVGVQTAVSAIVDANPDCVFFAGDAAAAARLRATLSQSGALAEPLLLAGSAAGDPGWGAAVGGALLGANTTGLLPGQNVTSMPGGKTFAAAYAAAFSGAQPTPQSALAYDAAIDEISALKALIAAGKTPTRAGALQAVATGTYSGVTGKIAFDATGDLASAPLFAVYATNAKGVWSYQTSVTGKLAAA
ncbi:MAG TPA: branched-chain amino acid ABC transporter substrate-binding protein [Ktedonobacterales bacterium]